jgi:hypothetical protein
VGREPLLDLLELPALLDVDAHDAVELVAHQVQAQDRGFTLDGDEAPIRRVACSMTTNTYNSLKVAVTTVKKSQATMPSA